MTQRIDRATLDVWLAELDGEVPKLVLNRNTFRRALEDRVVMILGRVDPQDEAYALAQLEAIVERSGFNA